RTTTDVARKGPVPNSAFGGALWLLAACPCRAGITFCVSARLALLYHTYAPVAAMIGLVIVCQREAIPRVVSPANLEAVFANAVFPASVNSRRRRVNAFSRRFGPWLRMCPRTTTSLPEVDDLCWRSADAVFVAFERVSSQPLANFRIILRERKRDDKEYVLDDRGNWGTVLALQYQKALGGDLRDRTIRSPARTARNLPKEAG
ncbi:MAG: hypothetical protein BJ554DRAFT_5161, partial [Olpidium bornovanus]